MAILRSEFPTAQLPESCDIRKELSRLHTVCVNLTMVTGSKSREATIQREVQKLSHFFGTEELIPVPEPLYFPEQYPSTVPAYRDLIRAIRIKTGIDIYTFNALSPLSISNDSALLIAAQLEYFLRSRRWYVSWAEFFQEFFAN